MADSQPATPADLARLQQHSKQGAPTAHRPQQSGNALFDYAHMGYVRPKADPRGSGELDVFDRLADVAEHENWDGLKPEAPGSNRILHNSIRWTFERARQQNKVSMSTDSACTAFNTGLATDRQEAIYGFFRRNNRPDSQSWALAGWRPGSDREFMDKFPPSLRPDFVTYTEDPADYIYNWRRELVVNVDHVLDDAGNLERFPAALQSNPYLARMALKGAVDGAVDQVRRNYKVAVPTWYPTHNAVQLLLPLSLLEVGSVDLALVVSKQGEFYRGHTVLTMAMAYNNARLLARPDSDWLKPAAEIDPS